MRVGASAMIASLLAMTRAEAFAPPPTLCKRLGSTRPQESSFMATSPFKAAPQHTMPSRILGEIPSQGDL